MSEVTDCFLHASHVRQRDWSDQAYFGISEVATLVLKAQREANYAFGSISTKYAFHSFLEGNMD